jgi:hypothetical protein
MEVLAAGKATMRVHKGDFQKRSRFALVMATSDFDAFVTKGEQGTGTGGFIALSERHLDSA